MKKARSGASARRQIAGTTPAAKVPTAAAGKVAASSRGAGRRETILAAALDEFDLGTWTIEVAVMKEQLQPPDNLLLATTQQRGDLMGT